MSVWFASEDGVESGSTTHSENIELRCQRICKLQQKQGIVYKTRSKFTRHHVEQSLRGMIMCTVYAVALVNLMHDDQLIPAGSHSIAFTFY